MIAAAFKAGALAAMLALPTNCPLTHPSAVHIPAGQVIAVLPPANGHFSAIKVPGGTSVEAEDINDSGVIVGCYKAQTSERAFVDRHGKISTFAEPAAGRHGSTCAFGINDAGIIVGDYFNSATGRFRAFVDRHGTFTSITAPAAAARSGQTVADDINRAGTVVGYYVVPPPRSKQAGFVLSEGKFSTVKVPLSAHSRPTASAITGIADNGAFTGIVSAGNRTHGFVDRAGKFTAIDVPHALGTEAACISEHGGIVVGGFQTTRSPFASVGFIFRSGVYRSLRDPAGPQRTYAECVNAQGYVVGFVENARGVITHAFLFTPARLSGRSGG